MRKKVIFINTQNDYRKFLKKVYLYKSIFYFNTYFEIKSEIKENDIDYIIHALNIKNRRRRIDYIYDQSCKIIDNSVKGINICGFKNNKCYIQRKLNNGKCNGCCRKCLYQTNSGCPTKNLACKLFNCSEVKLRNKVIKYEDIKLLKLFSLKNQLVVRSDYFSKREDVLKDLYSYSLIYSTIRIIFRYIRNFLLIRFISYDKI